MAKTQSDLITAVLSELNRVGSGQTPLPEDVTTVTPELQPLLDELAARRIVPAVDITAIPTLLFRGITRFIALQLGPKFGKVLEPPVFAAALASEEDRLRELSRLDRSAAPLVLAVLEQLEIFGATSDALDATAIGNRIPGILAELASRNVAYFSDADNVPDDAQPDLSRYIAASLASPTLYTVMDAAERRLRQRSGSNVASRPMRPSYF